MTSKKTQIFKQIPYRYSMFSFNKIRFSLGSACLCLLEFVEMDYSDPEIRLTGWWSTTRTVIRHYSTSSYDEKFWRQQSSLNPDSHRYGFEQKFVVRLLSKMQERSSENPKHFNSYQDPGPKCSGQKLHEANSSSLTKSLNWRRTHFIHK